MRRHPELILWLAAAGVLLVAYLFSTSGERAGRVPPLPAGSPARGTPTPRQEVSPLPESDAEVLSEIPAEIPSGAAASPAQRQAIEELHHRLPTKARVREEVRRNPHEVPPALLDFATSLGSLMRQAQSDPSLANELMGELEACLRDDSVVVSARALCLVQARKVSAAHEDLHGLRARAEVMEQDAPEEVRKLARSIRS